MVSFCAYSRGQAITAGNWNLMTEFVIGVNKMFKVGEYIICGSNGVCQVEEIGPMKIPGVSKDRIFYTLTPVYSGCSAVYTPTDNEKMIMRPVLSREEAWKLIENIAEIGIYEEPDNKRRDMIFKEALKTCDCKEWVKIINTLYLKKKNRIAQGKKEITSDEKYLQAAEENLYGELSIPLRMPKEKVESFISEKVDALIEDEAFA